MSRFRTNDANVASQVVKMAAISTAVAIPVSTVGRSVLATLARQGLITVGKTIQDPIRSWQRAGTILKTYRRVGQAAALADGLYNHFNRPKKYESSSPSSSSYQQNGGGGDTPTPAEYALAIGYLGHQVYEFATEKSYPKHPASPCRPGFVEKRVRGKLMCVRSSTHKK